MSYAFFHLYCVDVSILCVTFRNKSFLYTTLASLYHPKGQTLFFDFFIKNHPVEGNRDERTFSDRGCYTKVNPPNFSKCNLVTLRKILVG